MIAKKVLIVLACLTRSGAINVDGEVGIVLKDRRNLQTATTTAPGAFEEDFEAQYDLTAFTGVDGKPLGDPSGVQQAQEVFTEAQQCFGSLLDKFEVKNEAMDLIAYIGTPDWIETAEFGSKE